MPIYLYELSYTAESIAAQIKAPQDRLETAARPVLQAVGGKLLGGGYAFGDHDVVILYEAPDDESAAAVALAVAGGGAIRSSKTTKLLTGAQWVTSLKKAGTVTSTYKPAR
ncbi:MAG TPA: GYD domain-containing protein [Burkholderiales bacterium]|nr:GYD domain-containing protein [Burkholderiales bacterium]